jgi:hypothetical protein
VLHSQKRTLRPRFAKSIGRYTVKMILQQRQYRFQKAVKLYEGIAGVG